MLDMHMQKNILQPRLNLKKLSSYFFRIIFIIFLGLLFGSLLLMINGHDPLLLFSSIILRPLQSWGQFGSVLQKAAPLILTGLGAVLAWQVGVFNLGLEGQMIFGGLIGGCCAIFITGLSTPVHLLISCLAGAIAGAFYAFIPGYLSAYHGADEIVTTVMMNYIATLLLSYLLNNQLRDPTSAWAQSSPVATTAEFMQLLPPSRFHLGVIISFLITIVITIILFKSTLGYEIRMMGMNRRFTKYGGINVPKTILKAMALSGALAGLAGAIEVMGVHQKLLINFSAEFGWDGIAVALIAQLNPLAVIPAGLFMAMLRVGSSVMNMKEGIPIDLVKIVVAVILIFITANGFFKVLDRLISRYRNIVTKKNESNT